jgi:cytochrome c peroxidase
MSTRASPTIGRIARPRPASAGAHGTRNAPDRPQCPLSGLAILGWPRSTLEDQAKLPILNPVEMGQKTPEDVVAKLRTLPEYTQDFQRIYGHPTTYDDLASAIAAFERTQYSGNSPFDRFMAGNASAIDDNAKRGWALFNGKARCSDCHAFNSVSPLFSDQKFHNIGIAAHKQNFTDLARKAVGIVQSADAKQIDELALQSEYSELGRFLVTKKEDDIGAFKTETSRNIGITGPYMHDGSLTTLWDVIDHYNKGGVGNPYLDGGMQRLGLSESEIDDLVAFLLHSHRRSLRRLRQRGDGAADRAQEHAAAARDRRRRRPQGRPRRPRTQPRSQEPCAARRILGEPTDGSPIQEHRDEAP